jgi:hypothetical protein
MNSTFCEFINTGIVQEIEKQNSKVKAEHNLNIWGDFSFYHSRIRDCVENGRKKPKGVFVIPGLTRARSDALALSSSISDSYAAGCRIGPALNLIGGPA